MPVVRSSQDGSIIYNGTAAGMAGHNLQYGVLTGIDTNTFDWSGLDFTGTNLSDAVLTGGLFSGTQFSGATLSNTIMDRCSFNGCTLHDIVTTYPCYFREAVFAGCTLSNTNSGVLWSGWYFTKSIWNGNSLSLVNFGGCNFDNSLFNELTGTGSVSVQNEQFGGCSLVGAIFRTVSGIAFGGGNLTAGEISSFSDGVLGGTTVNACLVDTLSQVAISGIAFTGCTLRGTFTDCPNGSTQFVDCFTDGFQFATASTYDLHGPYFINMVFAMAPGPSNIPTFSGVTNFHTATFNNCQFLGADRNPVISFSGKNFTQGCSFINCNMRGVSFNGAYLDGCTFESCTMSLVALDGITSTSSFIELGNSYGPHFTAITNTTSTTGMLDLSSTYSVNKLKFQPVSGSQLLLPYNKVSNCMLVGNKLAPSGGGREIATCLADYLDGTALAIGGNSWNFRGSSLRYANLSNLTNGSYYFDGCDLTGADLSNCVCNASFLGANLSGANLSNSNFSQNYPAVGANLVGANLTGATFNTSLCLTEGSFDPTQPVYPPYNPGTTWSTIGTPITGSATGYGDGKIVGVYLTNGNTYTFDLDQVGTNMMLLTYSQQPLWPNDMSNNYDVTAWNYVMQSTPTGPGGAPRLVVTTTATGVYYLQCNFPGNAGTGYNYTLTNTYTVPAYPFVIDGRTVAAYDLQSATGGTTVADLTGHSHSLVASAGSGVYSSPDGWDCTAGTGISTTSGGTIISSLIDQCSLQVALTFKPTAYNSTDPAYLVSVGQPGGADGFYLTLNTSGYLELYVGGQFGFTAITTYTQVSLGVTHTVYVQLNNITKVITLYLDGVQVGYSSGFTYLNRATSSEMTVAMRPGGFPSTGYQGYIKYLSISNTYRPM